MGSKRQITLKRLPSCKDRKDSERRGGKGKHYIQGHLAQQWLLGMEQVSRVPAQFPLDQAAPESCAQADFILTMVHGQARFFCYLNTSQISATEYLLLEKA